MTLNDIFESLIHGELRQLYITGDAEPVDGMPKEKRKTILWSIQLGLTELHKRFLLREGAFLLDISEGKQTYVLDSKYAVSNTRSKEALKFINDTDESFQNNLLKVARIYDADGEEIPLNIIDDEDSIRTTSFNCLSVPATYAGTTLRVVYHADHATLDANLAMAAPAQVQVALPMSHLEALLFYVAARITNPAGMSNEFHEGSSYYGHFEASCQRLEMSGFKVEVTGANNRHERNGWP